MSKFKVGDKVRCIDAGTHADLKNGQEYTVSHVLEDGSEVGFEELGHHRPEYFVRRFELITNNTMKNIKESFTLAFKSEPEKSFRKAGITNGDDFFTEDGEKIFLAWLLKKHGAEFKKEVVDDLLKEETK